MRDYGKNEECGKLESMKRHVESIIRRLMGETRLLLPKASTFAEASLGSRLLAYPREMNLAELEGQLERAKSNSALWERRDSVGKHIGQKGEAELGEMLLQRIEDRSANANSRR